MEKNRLLQSDYLDILFDNRNKNYGGYELRKHYPDRARKAMVIVLIVTSIVATIPVIAGDLSGKTSIVRVPPRLRDTMTVVNILPKKEQPVLLKQSQQPAPFKPTVSNPILIIKENNLVVTPPKPIDSLDTKTVGRNDNAGSKDGLRPDNGDVAGNGKGDGKGKDKDGDIRPVVTTLPVTIAEEMPVFSGDINAYLQQHLQYPEAARDAGDAGRVIVQFVVNEDGAISQAVVR